VTVNTLFYEDEISNVSLNYNGTDYESTFILSIVDGFYYSEIYEVVLTTPEITGSVENVSFYWHLDVINNTLNTTETIITSTLNQTLWKKSIGECTGINVYPIGYFYFRDQLNMSLLNTDYIINLNLEDETKEFSVNLSGTDTNVTICTNLPTSNFDYEVELVGEFSLSTTNLENVTYIPKIYKFQTGNGYYMSNTDPLNLNLTLIYLENSTTIEFNWLTRGFQNVDGVMLIYETNGTQKTTLVEAVPIVENKAYANLQQLVQPYYMEAVVNGVLYNNPETYSQPRTLEAESYQFFLDTLTARNTSQFLGLQFTQCELNDEGNNIVNMVWGNNEKSSSPIVGCINVYKVSIFNSTIENQYCTTYGNTIRRQIVNSSDVYKVTGSLTQGGKTVSCGDEITLNFNSKTLANFGLASLFALVLMILGLMLFYAGNPEMSTIGAIIGILGSFWLGLTNSDWATIAGIILYYIVGIVVGRYARK
jgi:hypothetical protein